MAFAGHWHPSTQDCIARSRPIRTSSSPARRVLHAALAMALAVACSGAASAKGKDKDKDKDKEAW